MSQIHLDKPREVVSVCWGQGQAGISIGEREVMRKSRLAPAQGTSHVLVMALGAWGQKSSLGWASSHLLPV